MRHHQDTLPLGNRMAITVYVLVHFRQQTQGESFDLQAVPTIEPRRRAPLPNQPVRQIAGPLDTSLLGSLLEIIHLPSVAL